MELKVYDGWLGLMVGVLRRWRSSESLDKVWERVVSWSGGNCERKELGCRSGDRGVFGWF